MAVISEGTTTRYFADHGDGPGGRWLQLVMMRTGPHDDGVEGAVVMHDLDTVVVRSVDRCGEYDACIPVLPAGYVLVHGVYHVSSDYPQARVYETSEGWYFSKRPGEYVEIDDQEALYHIEPSE